MARINFNTIKNAANRVTQATTGRTPTVTATHSSSSNLKGPTGGVSRPQPSSRAPGQPPPRPGSSGGGDRPYWLPDKPISTPLGKKPAVTATHTSSSNLKGPTGGGSGIDWAAAGQQMLGRRPSGGKPSGSAHGVHTAPTPTPGPYTWQDTTGGWHTAGKDPMEGRPRPGGGWASPSSDDSYSGPTDYSSYIEEMHKAAQDAAIADIDAAWKNAALGYDRAEDRLGAGYQQNRNQAAAQADLAQRQFGEFAASSGLNSGGVAQAQLANANALQGALTDISNAEQNARSDLALARQQAENNYQAALTQARRDGDYRRVAALYQEKVRLDQMAADQYRFDTQVGLDRDRFNWQIGQADKDNAYRDRYFGWQQGQADKDNAYRDDYFTWQQGQAAADNAYRDQYFGWQQGQADKDNTYRDNYFGWQQSEAEKDRQTQADRWQQQTEQADKDRQDAVAKWLASLGYYGALDQLGVSPDVINTLYGMAMMQPGAGGAAPGGIQGVVNRMDGTVVPGQTAAPQVNPWLMIRQPYETEEQYQARIAQMGTLAQAPVDPYAYLKSNGHRILDKKMLGIGGRYSHPMDTEHPRVWGAGSPLYDMQTGTLSAHEYGDLLDSIAAQAAADQAAAVARQSGGPRSSDPAGTEIVPTDLLDTGDDKKPDPILSITGGTDHTTIVPTGMILKAPNPGMGALDQTAGALGTMSLSPVLTQAMTGDPVYDWYITHGYYPA